VQLRHCLSATFVALCIAAAAGQAQYVEDSIDVGGGGMGSLAYNSQADVVYGGCYAAAGIFFAISCDSNKVVKRLPIRYPTYVTYDSIDNKAYCIFNADNESLLVIDGATQTRVKSLPMYGAAVIVWDPASDHVYVSCQNTNSVAIVDCASDSVLTYIPVGAGPMKMYRSTLRRKLYILNYDDGTVSIVNTVTNQVVRTVTVGGTPNAGYYCRRADKLFSDGEYGYCTVIGGQSDTIVARIALPGTNVEVIGATGNETDALVYLGTLGGGHHDTVATVSAQNDSLLATVAVGAVPYALAFYAPSRLLYCAPDMDTEVYVLTRDGRQILTTLRVGGSPSVFAVAPRHNRLYLGNLGGRYMFVLKDTSAGIAEPLSCSPGFHGISVMPNPFSQSVTVARNTPLKGGDAARVYAQDGRLVRQARIPAGESRWVWDGRDDSGAPLPPGVYVIEAGQGLRAKVVKLR